MQRPFNDDGTRPQVQQTTETASAQGDKPMPAPADEPMPARANAADAMASANTDAKARGDANVHHHPRSVTPAVFTLRKLCVQPEDPTMAQIILRKDGPQQMNDTMDGKFEDVSHLLEAVYNLKMDETNSENDAEAIQLIQEELEE